MNPMATPNTPPEERQPCRRCGNPYVPIGRCINLCNDCILENRKKQEIAKINSELVVTRFNGERFKALDKDGYYVPTGYALKHPTLGWFAFAETFGCPYSPAGANGKRTLELILEAGGFTNFDTAVWLKEL